MVEVTVRESKDSEPVDLSSLEVEALTRMGRRLASQTSWWGENEGESSGRETSAIKCVRAGDGRWRVRVDNAVGVVRVGNVQIVVEPKIPLSHLLYLMAEAGSLPRLDEERASLAADQSLWALVAAWFTASAESLLRRGLIRDYQETRQDLSLIRGRVQPPRTATNFYVGRVAFDCEFDEFDIDTPLNRIVLAAARAVASSVLLASDVRRRAMSIAVRMDEGVQDLAAGDLRAAFDRRTAHYAEVIPLARHVLRSRGRTLAGGEELGWSFLIPTPALVEEGIRNVLNRGLTPKYWVKKRGRQLEGSTLTFNPDLVFGPSAAVGDVKYKLTSTTWNRADLYEVIAFGVAFRAERTCLVTFNQSSGDRRFSDLRVGDIRVSHLVWDADLARSPIDSADALVASARSWLQDAAWKVLGQNSLGANEAAMSG
jgi:hypothetical protein